MPGRNWTKGSVSGGVQRGGGTLARLAAVAALAVLSVSSLQGQESMQSLRDTVAKQAEIVAGQQVSKQASFGRRSGATADLQSQMQAATTEREQILHRSDAGAARGSSPTMGGATKAPGTSTGLGAAQRGPAEASDLCRQGKPFIATINGRRQGAVFTPDPQYNLYTIKGCNLGMRQGQMHLVGRFRSGPQVGMIVNFWSDDSIIASMDSGVSGELDQSDVHLVVILASGQQLDFPGQRFYAVRETTTLTTIPKDWVRFASVKDAGGHPVPTAYWPTASVSRASGDRFSGGGQDYYDFSRLKPGFTTESFHLSYLWINHYNTAITTVYTDGLFQAAWDGDNVAVTLGAQTEHNNAVRTDRAFSVYSLTVQVTGPRGVDPVN